MSTGDSDARSTPEGDWADRFDALLPRVKKMAVQKRPKYCLRTNSIIGTITKAALDGNTNYKAACDFRVVSRGAYRIAMLRIRRFGLMSASGLLTQQGRWYGICAKLGISMTALCILADMYVVSMILRSTFSSKLYKRDRRLIKRLNISEKGMRNVYDILVRKGYIHSRYGHDQKNAPEVVYMSDDLFEWFHEYMLDMMVLKKTFNDPTDMTPKPV